MTVTVLSNQSFLDLAIQHTGTVYNAFAIAVANNMAVSDSLASGSSLIIPDTVIIETDIRDYLKNKGIKPATAITDESILEDKKGIGVMKLTKTFKIG